MKLQIPPMLGSRMLAPALVVMLACCQMALPACGAESVKEGTAGIAEHLKKWQEKMSDTFREALKGISKGNTGDGSASAVSADFREQNDSYMLRLNLPKRTLDRVEVTFAGDTLRVIAPEEGGAQRYEQSITLGNVPADATPAVERKQADGLIVITIPKSPARGEVSSAKSKDRPEPPPYLARDTEIMQRMEQMRRDMDRVFEDSFNAFKFLPSYRDIFDEYRFGSTYDVEDKGDSYEVRVFLPDRAMENVTATVEGQTLQIEANDENSASSQKNADGVSVHKARYIQRITLPGPVNKAKMKVEKKERMMVVMLPKAITL